MPNKPDAAIIKCLNTVLTGELTAINQYFLHSEMCADWGYERLHQKMRSESIDEMKHAEQLIERVLYLGGIPNVQKLDRIVIGENVEEMLESDKALEQLAIPRLNTGIALAVKKGDNGTRHLLESILTSEEEHLDWLEAQHDQIAQMGIANYLANQVKEEE
jgi:bacterioferritin